MSTVAKILVVLNLLLAGYFLSSASSFLAQQDNFKKELAAEKTSHDTTKSNKDDEIADLRGRLNASQTDLQKVQTEAEKLRAESTRIAGENTHMREAYNQLSENATRAARAVDTLTASLNASSTRIDLLQGQNSKLGDNLKAAQDDRDAKVAQVNALQQQLSNETENRKSLEGKLAGAQDTIKRQGFELSYIKDKFPGVIASNQPAHSGRILSADNDANVYVISLGEEDGVKAGFQYIVSRGSEYIGTIQITDVQAKQAAGRAMKSLSKGAINRGDKVMNGN